MFIGPCIIAIVHEWKTHLMSLAIYFTYYALNMFRTLIYPSSGASDCVDELPHRSSCSQFVVCWSFCCGWYLVVFVLQAEAQRLIQSDTKKRELLKTQTKIEEILKKILLTEIEPLQLAFKRGCLKVPVPQCYQLYMAATTHFRSSRFFFLSPCICIAKRCFHIACPNNYMFRPLCRP